MVAVVLLLRGEQLQLVVDGRLVALPVALVLLHLGVQHLQVALYVVRVVAELPQVFVRLSTGLPLLKVKVKII